MHCRALYLFVLACASSTATAGCDSETKPPPLPPADATYTVRGVVVQAPSDDDSKWVIHHEAIESFKDVEGKVTGMPSMAMAFSASPDIPKVEQGDKVEVDFEVRWASEDKLRIVALRKLPKSEDLAISGHGSAHSSP